MKQPVPDLKWLPSAEEWDFRSVTESECRVACHWEYSREIQKHFDASLRPLPGARPASTNNQGTILASSKLFPKAWCALSAEERAGLVDKLGAAPSLQVRPLGEALEQARMVERLGSAAYGQWQRGAYLIRPNFSGAGVESVIQQFEAWARKEAKNHPRSPRAKAAAAPFDLLKWLAVSRLDAARVTARLTYEAARMALLHYRRMNPRQDRHGVFPIYASHGAWSKARRDAMEFRSRFLGNASLLPGGPG